MHDLTGLSVEGVKAGWVGPASLPPGAAAAFSTALVAWLSWPHG
jgi:hypothetical protein